MACLVWWRLDWCDHLQPAGKHDLLLPGERSAAMYYMTAACPDVGWGPTVLPQQAHPQHVTGGIPWLLLAVRQHDSARNKLLHKNSLVVGALGEQGRLRQAQPSDGPHQLLRLLPGLCQGL